MWRQPGSGVSLLPALGSRLRWGHVGPLVFRALGAPALPRQARHGLSSLSWVCLGPAGEEHPLPCAVGVGGEESPPLLSPLGHRERGPPMAVWLRTPAWPKAAVPGVGLLRSVGCFSLGLC